MADFSQTIDETSGSAISLSNSPNIPIIETIGAIDSFERINDAIRSFSEVSGTFDSVALPTSFSQSISEVVGTIDSLPKPTPSKVFSEVVGSDDVESERKRKIRGIDTIRGLLS